MVQQAGRMATDLRGCSSGRTKPKGAERVFLVEKLGVVKQVLLA